MDGGCTSLTVSCDVVRAFTQDAPRADGDPVAPSVSRFATPRCMPDNARRTCKGVIIEYTVPIYPHADMAATCNSEKRPQLPFEY
jgi:hypothetical protein